MAKRATGSKRYTVRNVRGIDDGVPIITDADGIEYADGDTISDDRLSATAIASWLARGILEG